MGKHHTEDYKLSAVKYALRTDNQVETCEVFDCKRSSLQEWIYLYQKTGSPVRKTRKKCFLRRFRISVRTVSHISVLRNICVHCCVSNEFEFSRIARLFSMNSAFGAKMRRYVGHSYDYMRHS